MANGCEYCELYECLLSTQINSKNLGRGIAVGIERKRFMQVTQMWPFSSPSPTDDKLQVWRNRLFGYKKPSIMISVIISSWPRPHSNQVISNWDNFVYATTFSDFAW